MYTEQELKSIRNKRSGKTRKIIAWVLIILGLKTLIITIAGIVLLVMTNKQVKLWDRYDALINKRGNTSFDYMCTQLGKSDAEIIEDLKVMIQNGFFAGPDGDIEAILDTKRRYLVMTRNGEQMEAFVKHEEEKPEEEQAQEEVSYVDRIREIIIKTNDEEVKNNLYDLEGSIRRMEERIAENPQLWLMDDVIKLEEYYLPQTYELIEKLYKHDGTPETLEQIKETLGICAGVFRRIEQKMVSATDIDTVGDIAVLRNAFAREGLLEPDFKVQ